MKIKIKKRKKTEKKNLINGKDENHDNKRII